MSDTREQVRSMLTALKQPGSLQCCIDNQHCQQYNITLNNCIPCLDAVFPWQDSSEQAWGQDASLACRIRQLPCLTSTHIQNDKHTHQRIQSIKLSTYACAPKSTVTVDPHCQSAGVRRLCALHLHNQLKGTTGGKLAQARTWLLWVCLCPAWRFPQADPVPQSPL